MPKAGKTGKKAASSNVTDTKAATATNQQAPNWPPFKPLIPAQDLYLETILDYQIFTIPRLFTANLCSAYTSFLSSLPLVTTPGKPKKGDAVRVNDRFQLQDPTFAKRLWRETGLQEIVEREESKELLWKPEELAKGVRVWGLNPNIRIYRYTKGQFFDKHFDESNKLVVGSPAVPHYTIYTLLIYLTGPEDGVVGGETTFYPEETYAPLSKKQLKERSGNVPQVIDCQPERGMALLHRHGDECLLHEGKLVEEGIKWIIRSDIVVQT